MSSNGNIFQVTGEFPAHKSQWHRALLFSLIYLWTNGWVNNRDAGGLRRHRAHYDVTVNVGKILSTLFRLQCIKDRVIWTMIYKHNEHMETECPVTIDKKSALVEIMAMHKWNVSSLDKKWHVACICDPPGYNKLNLSINRFCRDKCRYGNCLQFWQVEQSYCELAMPLWGMWLHWCRVFTTLLQTCYDCTSATIKIKSN